MPVHYDEKYARGANCCRTLPFARTGASPVLAAAKQRQLVAALQYIARGKRGQLKLAVRDWDWVAIALRNVSAERESGSAGSGLLESLPRLASSRAERSSLASLVEFWSPLTSIRSLSRLASPSKQQHPYPLDKDLRLPQQGLLLIVVICVAAFTGEKLALVFA